MTEKTLGQWDGVSGGPFLNAGVAKPAREEEQCSKPFQFLLEDKRKKYVSSMSALIYSDGCAECFGFTTRCYSCQTGLWAAHSVARMCSGKRARNHFRDCPLPTSF